MATTNAYEVELKLVNRNTFDERLVTRTEYAYSVQDAVMQAVVNQAADPGTGSAEVKVLRIGPPQELVLAASQSVLDMIATLTRQPGGKR